MSWISIDEARTTLQMWLDAERAVATGQSYKSTTVQIQQEWKRVPAFGAKSGRRNVLHIMCDVERPTTLFGGTWEALDDGRVLIGANDTYKAGTTGGEATHKITTAEMPS